MGVSEEVWHKVSRRAKHTYCRPVWTDHRASHKYEESDLGYFSDMVNGGNFDLKRMQAWDLPVCDIETVDQPKVALDCPPDWSVSHYCF
jgi:hypothetical protein